MISHSIVKQKPIVHLTPTRSSPAYQHGGWSTTNKSTITNDAMLEEFLKSAPLEGTWCYRKRWPGYDRDTVLNDRGQCQYVIRILRSLGHVELKYGHSGSFPETHEIINTIAYSTGDHYRRFVDIRDYETLTEDQLNTFIDAKLQDHIQSIIAPGTKQS